MKLHYNAPVVLTLTLVSILVLSLNPLTQGQLIPAFSPLPLTHLYLIFRHTFPETYFIPVGHFWETSGMFESSTPTSTPPVSITEESG